MKQLRLMLSVVDENDIPFNDKYSYGIILHEKLIDACNSKRMVKIVAECVLDEFKPFLKKILKNKKIKNIMVEE